MISRRDFLTAGVMWVSARSFEPARFETSPKAAGMEKSTPKPTDIRVLDVQCSFEEHKYRAPYQFGGRTVDRKTLLNVNVRVTSVAGKEASGFGAMALGNAWAFLSQGSPMTSQRKR